MPAATAGVGVASSLIGGILGSSAAKDAANAQADSERQAISGTNAAASSALGTQSSVYNTDQANVQPYQGAGTAALSQLGAGTAAGGQFNSTPSGAQVLAQDPGYQFRLDQGQLALSRAAAAGGGVGSGGALKSAAQYGQDYASGEYGAAYNRFMTTRQDNYANLSGLARMGETANGQSMQAGQNYANQSSSIGTNAAFQNAQALNGIGNAQAAGDIGSANAWSGALSGIGKAASDFNFGGGPDVNTPTWNPANGQEVYPTR